MAIARAGSVQDLGLVNPLSDNGGTEYNKTFTLDSAANILFVGAFGDGADTLDGATKPTWNGVSMTLINKLNNSGDRYCYLWFIVNPATGSNTLKITSTSSGIAVHAVAMGYSGASTTGQPDAQSTAVGVLSLTGTVTVVAANCWMIMVDRHNTATNSTAGAGTSLLVDTSTGLAIFDSNGTKGTGSQSLISNNAGAALMAGVVASFSPGTGVATVIHNLPLIGVGA